MKKVISLLSVAALIFTSFLNAQFRTLVDREGREIPIFYHSSNDGIIQFIRTDTGHDFQVPVGNLSSKSINDLQEWDKQPFKGSIEELRIILASNYYEGSGGAREDKERAFKIFKISAEKAVPYAQMMLGLMYANGEGVQKHGTLAGVWIKKAADSGYTEAENYLGWLYMNGECVSKSYDKAATYLGRAAGKDNSHAKVGLGLLYLYGNGVVKDTAKGLSLMSEAADDGHEGAKNFLKEYNSDSGVAQKNHYANNAQSRSYYREDRFGAYVSELLYRAESRYGVSSSQVKRLKFTKKFYYYLKAQYPNDQITFVMPQGKTDELIIGMYGNSFKQLEYFQIAWWVMSSAAPTLAGVKDFSDLDNKMQFESIILNADSSTPEYNGYDLVIWYERNWEGKKNFKQ